MEQAAGLVAAGIEAARVASSVGRAEGLVGLVVDLVGMVGEAGRAGWEAARAEVATDATQHKRVQRPNRDRTCLRLWRARIRRGLPRYPYT